MPTFGYQVLPDLSGFESEEARRVRELIGEYEAKKREWFALKREHERVRDGEAAAVAKDEAARAELVRVEEDSRVKEGSLALIKARPHHGAHRREARPDVGGARGDGAGPP